MSAVVAIGDAARLAGYAAAGVTVAPARDPREAIAAWEGPARDAGLLVLTEAAHAALADRLSERRVLWVVLPR